MCATCSLQIILLDFTTLRKRQAKSLDTTSVKYMHTPMNNILIIFLEQYACVGEVAYKLRI
jgi:hypothetical protein